MLAVVKSPCFQYLKLETVEKSPVFVHRLDPQDWNQLAFEGMKRRFEGEHALGKIVPSQLAHLTDIQ